MSMSFDSFDSQRIIRLFRAQEVVLCHLARSYELTDEIKAKAAKVIMRIGRKRLLVNAEFDADEIAMDALFVLMTLSAPSREQNVSPN